MTAPCHQIDLFQDCIAEISAHEQQTIREAFKILERSLRKPGAAMTMPEQVANYMKLNIATREHEVFVVMFLDSQHRLIETQEMFRGTINQASVYPREIVKEALRLNAGACILAHNHPSGIAEPSLADKEITKKIKQALELIEVKVLDHFVIGGLSHTSFAEQGLMP
ncbi:MAG: DNA repair protein RadC [Methylococcales bacterium]|nr:DNA repair protein RadC [Methylococcales bacterium]